MILWLDFEGRGSFILSSAGTSNKPRLPHWPNCSTTATFICANDFPIRLLLSWGQGSNSAWLFYSSRWSGACTQQVFNNRLWNQEVNILNHEHSRSGKEASLSWERTCSGLPAGGFPHSPSGMSALHLWLHLSVLGSFQSFCRPGSSPDQFNQDLGEQESGVRTLKIAPENSNCSQGWAPQFQILPILMFQYLTLFFMPWLAFPAVPIFQRLSDLPKVQVSSKQWSSDLNLSKLISESFLLMTNFPVLMTGWCGASAVLSIRYLSHTGTWMFTLMQDPNQTQKASSKKSGPRGSLRWGGWDAQKGNRSEELASCPRHSLPTEEHEIDRLSCWGEIDRWSCWGGNRVSGWAGKGNQVALGWNSNCIPH